MTAVSDYMVRDVIAFRPDQDVHKAMKLFVKHGISGAPVVDADGRLVGMLTDKDCLRVAFSASYHGEWGGKVADFMATEVETVDAETDIVEAAQLFLERPYHRFPVMEHGRLVGLISRHDILGALKDQW